jgi:hypothetical protein
MLSVFGSVLRAFVGADGEVDWECVIECNWEYTGKRVQECA